VTKTAVVPLAQVADIAAGQPAPQDRSAFDTDGLPFIRAGSLSALAAGADELNFERVPAAAAERHGLRVFEAGTVLFAKSGMSATLGIVHQLRQRAYVVSHLAALTPRSGLDPAYLSRWLQAHPPSRLIPNDSYPSIRLSEIGRLRIPLPPLAEQRRIAAVLGKADALRRQAAGALGLIDELRESAFVEMCGDPARNPRGWPVKRLEELLIFLTSGSRGWAKYYSESGSAFLRIQNVGRNRLILDDVARLTPPNDAEAERTKVRPGDVLLSITADLGRTAVVPESLIDAHINQHLAVLRVKGIEPNYLSAFLASAAGQRQIIRLNREGVKAGLNFDDIRSLKVVCPPVTVQERYTRFSRTLSGEEGRLQERRLMSEGLFDSLLHGTFRDV